MQAALVVPRITADSKNNRATILTMAKDAAVSGADLILFPEATLTGLINNDDPEHDLPLGEEIPGPFTDLLSAFCSRHAAWLGVGLLERENNQLWDSAILIGPSGAIVLKYRRIQPQWHGRDADPDVYCQGSSLDTVQTPFGSAAFLICGDLFNDAIVSRMSTLHPDYLLFPFARCFPKASFNQHRWDAREMPEYIKRLKMIESPALMVNYLGDVSLPGDNSFGGAFAVSVQGEVIAKHPLGAEGVLMVDMERMLNRKKRPKAQHPDPRQRLLAQAQEPPLALFRTAVSAPLLARPQSHRAALAHHEGQLVCQHPLQGPQGAHGARRPSIARPDPTPRAYDQNHRLNRNRFMRNALYPGNPQYRRHRHGDSDDCIPPSASCELASGP